jgi:hypothetical protein
MSKTAIHVISITIPLALGTMAALWTSLSLWYDMKEGLIAFLGFLAVALIQIMPLTTNFLQMDRLTPLEAERLTASLTKQQYYWMGLLFAAIATMVIVIVGAALKDRIANVPPVFWGIEWAAVVCFLIGASVSFVLIKMLGLFEGIMSLHHLRGELVIGAAKREAAERMDALQRNAEVTRQIVPSDYGSLVRPPH